MHNKIQAPLKPIKWVVELYLKIVYFKIRSGYVYYAEPWMLKENHLIRV